MGDEEQRAGMEGWPIKKAATSSSKQQQQQSSSTKSDSGKTRAERIQEEMDKAKSMSVGDLRKELTSRGIKTNAFFEKSDFVKAYAEAIVDGVKVNGAGAGSSSGGRAQEKYDPSYRDVNVRKLDPSTKRMLQGSVIDIRAKP